MKLKGDSLIYLRGCLKICDFETASYQLAATINAINNTIPVTSWIDADAMKSTVRKLYYKITAMDINQHESLFSNVVWRFGRLGKIISQDISNFEYGLYNNYPAYLTRQQKFLIQ